MINRFLPGLRDQRGAARMVLAGAALAFLAFDSVRAARCGMSAPLALFYGSVLTGLATGPGIIAWSGRGDRVTRLFAAAVMLTAVFLSAGAASTVAAPAAPGPLHVLFAAALALSLLAALRAVLAPSPLPAPVDGPADFVVGKVLPDVTGTMDFEDRRVPADAGASGR